MHDNYHFKNLFLHTRLLLSSSVLKEFFTYSFGAVLLRGLTILLAPFILRKISPEEYGILSLINSFIFIVVPIAGLGLRQVLTLEYFHCDGIARQKLVNTVIVIYLLVSTPLFALLYASRTQLQHYLWNRELDDRLVVIGITSTFMIFFAELFYQLLRYERKALMLTALQIIIAVATATGTFVLLFVFDGGVASILGMQCFGTFAACCVGLGTYYKYQYHTCIQPKKIINTAGYYLSYGIVFVPNLLFAWILVSGDRWLLARYANLHDVGIYAVASTLGQLFHLLILTPWTGSYLPYILNKFAQNKDNVFAIEKQNQRNMWLTMTGVIIIIALGYFLCRPILYRLLPPTYHEAPIYALTLLFGYVFLLGSYFASSLIQFLKKKNFLASALCIPALLNVFLNYQLIPRFGLYGCTSATLLAYMLYFVMTLSYNRYLLADIQRNKQKKIILPACHHHKKDADLAHNPVHNSNVGTKTPQQTSQRSSNSLQ